VSACPTVPLCPLPSTSSTFVATSAIPVAVNTASTSPGTEAVTLLDPIKLPSCQLPVVARPAASVVASVGPSAPSPPSAKFTETPGTGLPYTSWTSTTGAVSSVATTAVCGSSDRLTIVVGAPGCAVALNTTGEPVKPETDAVAVCGPATVPSVRVAVATPLMSVNDVAGRRSPPAASTAQCTCTPCTGAPPASRTRTAYCVPRVAATTPLCPSPALSAMLVAVVVMPLALNRTVLASGVAVASSVLRPIKPPSVHAVARAVPVASVVAASGVTLPPPRIAAKSTENPAIGLPY
jgi:hypothetical protein